MTERTNDAESKVFERSNPFEREEQIQRALDAYIKLGTKLSSRRIGSEELAMEIAREVNVKLGVMAGKGPNLGQTMLRVSGPSAYKINYTSDTSEGSDSLGFATTVDVTEPLRPLGAFEERPFQAEFVTPSVWKDAEAGCWRVGVRIRGNDPIGSSMRQITDTDGYPLVTIRNQPSMIIECNELTQIEVESLARRRERDESIAGLRGRIGSGLLRMIKVIDREMTYKNSADYIELNNVHYLRVLGKHCMSIAEPGLADAVSTTISKVLYSETGIIVGGVSYAAGDLHKPQAIPTFSMVNGLVADVIPNVPIAAEDPVGPTLVMIGRDGKLDDPTFMPLKDIHHFKH